jgi:hypothetical protein
MCRVRTSRVRQEEHITIKSRLCVRSFNQRLESKMLLTGLWLSSIRPGKSNMIDAFRFHQLPPLAKLGETLGRYRVVLQRRDTFQGQQRLYIPRHAILGDISHLLDIICYVFL